MFVVMMFILFAGVLSLAIGSNGIEGGMTIMALMPFFSTAGTSSNVATGKSGKLYYNEYEDMQTTTGDIVAGTWIKIEARGDSSGLPNISVGRHIRVLNTITLATGDKVRKFIPILCTTVRDVSVPKSKEKIDISTQASRSSDYAVADIVDREGNISGVFKAADPLFMAVEAEFDDTVTINSDGSTSESRIESSTYHCMISRDEKGSTEVWEYMPIKFTKSDSTKSQKGEQLVSWDYFTVGSEGPHRLVIQKS